ncbi:MAG: hypothetical protein CVV44_17130 [Spirochaetae bacterium HGW-Spirochaetae-1]|nr:MAG: hypothetical protein CVV44_17130 [Spirochaetae bacterium HGW-Spirochaetae-1]
MNFKTLGLTLTLAAALGGGAVFAQDAPAPVKEEKKESKMGSLSGEAYFGYTQDLEDNDGNDKKDGSFTLDRVYVTWKKDMGDNFSARVTADIADVSTTDDNAVSGGDDATNPRGYFFVKYAYFQYKNKIGDIGLETQAGLIGNPIIGITDKLGGMRWLTQNQIDSQKINNSADLGVSLAVDLMGFATLTGAVLNGEGYKYVFDETYSGKSIDTLLSITPIKGLYINGYFKNEYYAKDQVDRFFGAGIAWSDKLYKVGVNYVYVSDSEKAKLGSYIDAWANANLNDAISMPVLIVGRFQYRMPKESSDDSLTSFFFGPGYQFNENLQTAAIFGYSKAESADDADMNLTLKAEFKF